MTTEKKPTTTTRKASTRKAPVKKEEKLEVEIKAEETAIKTTARAKRVEIDSNELIPCRSTTHGNLIYISTRTGERIFWYDYGDVQDITMGELKNLHSSYPSFINDVLFVIDDEDAIEYLGLSKLYDTIFDIGNLDTFFDKEYRELEDTLSKLPKGLKDSVSTKAREMIKEGTLDSRSKIKLIEEKLQIELLLFED